MSQNSKPSLVNTKLPTFAVPPASPQSPRKLRKFQSHQSLTSTAFSSFGQPLPTTTTVTGNNGSGNRQRDVAGNGATTDIQLDTNVRPRTRGRSNSESGSSNPTPLMTGTARPKRPARKTDSSGYFIKRSGLDALLRDGPADGRLLETLQELRLMVLSNRVDADSDGMVWKSGAWDFSITNSWGSVYISNISLASPPRGPSITDRRIP
jgi:cell cycle arrest protein BUB2